MSTYLVHIRSLFHSKWKLLRLIKTKKTRAAKSVPKLPNVVTRTFFKNQRLFYLHWTILFFFLLFGSLVFYRLLRHFWISRSKIVFSKVRHKMAKNNFSYKIQKLVKVPKSPRQGKPKYHCERTYCFWPEKSFTCQSVFSSFLPKIYKILQSFRFENFQSAKSIKKYEKFMVSFAYQVR